MKIVVVDDSRAMRMLVVRNLRKAGFADAEISEAANGVEGLEVVAQVRPDVILSDWNMPEMTGIDFLKALRVAGDETLFGFVTSETTPQMRAAAAEAGAAFVLGKPFTPENFADVIGAHLGV